MSTNTTPTRRASTLGTNQNNNHLNKKAAEIALTEFNNKKHNEKKRKARELLRDYYQLNNNKAESVEPGGVGGEGEESEASSLDINSTTTPFDHLKYYNNLTSTSDLNQLIKTENELLNEIRELDGERQSLVYNHHHELIEASDTIKKMKSRALALDTSLDSLKTSFESISQLHSSLSSSPCPPPRPSTSKNTAIVSTSAPTSPTLPQQFNPLLHLPPLISLPTLLKNSSSTSSTSTSTSTTDVDSSNSSRERSLWGTWEPILREWDELGVLGVKEVQSECREVLVMMGRGRSASTSLSGTVR